MQDPDTSAWIPESELVLRLGLSRSELHGLRDRLAADHWRRGKHDRVEWSAAGVDFALSLLGAEKAALAQEIAAPAAPASVESLTVRRWDFPNPQVIECQKQDGTVVLVRVKSNKNFRPKLANGEPMTVPARQVNGQWWLQGPCPRWPGKW